MHDDKTRNAAEDFNDAGRCGNDMVCDTKLVPGRDKGLCQSCFAGMRRAIERVHGPVRW